MQIRTSLFLTILMIAATLGPAMAPTVAAEAENNYEVGEIIGDIDDFVKAYLMKKATGELNQG